jgi:hypothetical protein
MSHVEWENFLNQGVLVIYKYLQVVIIQDVKIYFVSIIPDCHYKCSMLIQEFYLLLEREFFIVSPSNHTTTYFKKLNGSMLMFPYFLLK